MIHSTPSYRSIETELEEALREYFGTDAAGKLEGNIRGFFHQMELSQVFRKADIYIDTTDPRALAGILADEDSMVRRCLLIVLTGEE